MSESYRRENTTKSECLWSLSFSLWNVSMELFETSRTKWYIYAEAFNAMGMLHCLCNYLQLNI